MDNVQLARRTAEAAVSALFEPARLTLADELHALRAYRARAAAENAETYRAYAAQLTAAAAAHTED